MTRKKGGTWIEQTNRGEYIIRFGVVGEMRKHKKIKQLIQKYETEKRKGLTKQMIQTKKGLHKLGIIIK
ncbi:MAG: hypothetical protein AABY22_03845 [Nanoarchaeota archaeon]